MQVPTIGRRDKSFTVLCICPSSMLGLAQQQGANMEVAMQACCNKCSAVIHVRCDWGAWQLQQCSTNLNRSFTSRSSQGFTSPMSVQQPDCHVTWAPVLPIQGLVNSCG